MIDGLSKEMSDWYEKLWCDFEGWAVNVQHGDERAYHITEKDLEAFLYYAAKDIGWALSKERAEEVNVPQQWVKLWKRTYHTLRGHYKRKR